MANRHEHNNGAVPGRTPRLPGTRLAVYGGPKGGGPACDDENGPDGTIYRLYRAYLVRSPDPGGFSYWVDQYTNQNYPLAAISDDFTRSAEFRTRYGDVDDRAFLELVYNNVLGRAADEGGYAYWLDHMAKGMRRGYVMIYFSDSAEFRDKTGPPTPPPPTEPGPPEPVECSIEFSHENRAGCHTTVRGYDVKYFPPADGDPIDHVEAHQGARSSHGARARPCGHYEARRSSARKAWSRRQRGPGRLLRRRPGVVIELRPRSL